MAFTDEFSKDAQKQTQWRAFVRKSKPVDMSRDFDVVIDDVTVFLMPVLEIARGDDHFGLSWPEGGPWD
jgi:hypothetical protein